MSYLGLLNQSVTIYGKSSRTRYGRENYGSGTATKARIEQADKTVFQAPIGVSSQGTEVIPINATIFVSGDTAVEVGDKITTTATDESSESISYKVMRKKVATDGRGSAHHITLECQKWVV